MGRFTYDLRKNLNFLTPPSVTKFALKRLQALHLKFTDIICTATVRKRLINLTRVNTCRRMNFKRLIFHEGNSSINLDQLYLRWKMTYLRYLQVHKQFRRTHKTAIDDQFLKHFFTIFFFFFFETKANTTHISARQKALWYRTEGIYRRKQTYTIHILRWIFMANNNMQCTHELSWYCSFSVLTSSTIMCLYTLAIVHTHKIFPKNIRRSKVTFFLQPAVCT